ncbi:hypothetical protein Bca52824_034190 [Brassica carinata]|uniref:DUF3444 domain-containing protein n=1 Tax=Brassica carinata TaxID=52824 RepID=A0A8X7SE85_BRACI|nr:hypothetical protein Bca52824_034190 [Brassica carinata]
MERTNLEDELKLCEVKRVNLDKAFHKLHSQASELLVFTNQWRDFEDYLKSVQGQVEKRFMDLESREVELQNRSLAIDTIGDLEVKADGLKREIEDKEEVLKNLVEEYTVKQRSKASQLDEVMESLRKSQADLDSKGRQLAQMETDLERRRVEITAEMDHLGRAQTLRRELDEENVRKTRDLTLIQDKVVECGKLLETRSLELTKTQGELGLKVEQLGHVKIEFTAEMEHLEKIQTRNRELEEVIERKRKDLAAVLDKTAERGKQLEVVEEQLASQQKLLETCSLELVSKEKDLQELSLDLDLREQMVKSLNSEMEETCQNMESKAKELEDIKLMIEELTEELASKEKRHKEITEDIHKLSCKQLSKEERYIAEHESAKKELKSLKTILTERDKQVEEGEKQIQRLSNSNKELIKQLKVRQEQFYSTKSSTTGLIAEQDSVTKKLRSVKDAFRQCRQNVCNKEKELRSLESVLTERNKQVEEEEKKIQDLNNSSDELVRQVKVKEEQVCSIEKAIRECTDELEAKRKDCDQVQSSITGLTFELKSKECHLSSVMKKIQESMEVLQSLEDQKVRLKSSLMEQEQGLELRAKELDEKDEKLKATEQELAKWVKDYEVKSKQLSSFCKERNKDQHVALTPVDVHKPTGNSRKRGRYDDESLSQSLGMKTYGKENSYNFENLRSPDKFEIDQIWAVYSNSDKGMPRKYAQIKRIDTSPEFKLHVAPLVLYRPPPNLMTHSVCCGQFKLKIGKAEVLVPSSFSHKVRAVRSSVNRFDVYPGKGEIWALYKNWNITDCADGAEEEELEIVEVVEIKEQSIQAMLLTAKVFSKLLYGRCLESKADVVDIPKKELNRFSHQIPAVRRERSGTQSGDCEWWELDSKAVLDLNPKKYKSISTGKNLLPQVSQIFNIYINKF